jgi:two-component system CheB/CheR fusion protein
VADPEGRLLTWDVGVERTFGYKEEEWIGQDVSLIFTEEDRAAGIPRTEMNTAAERAGAWISAGTCAKTVHACS